MWSWNCGYGFGKSSPYLLAVRPEVSVDKMIQGLELASKLSGTGRMVSGGGSRWPERKRDERLVGDR